MTTPPPDPDDPRSQGAADPGHRGGPPAYPGGVGPMPGGNQTTQQGPAPHDVENSVKLWFVSIALGVLGAIVGLLLTDRDVAAQTVLDANSSLSASQAETAVNLTLIGGLVVGLLILGLELLFVIKMRAGRNWARITLTVLGGLSVLFGLFGLSAGFTIGSLVNLVSILLVVAAIVLMYRPAANAYFARPMS